MVIYNLGTGTGYCIEMVHAFEKVIGKIPYEIVGRRPGDIAICYARILQKAREELAGKHNILWKYVVTVGDGRNNPNG